MSRHLHIMRGVIWALAAIFYLYEFLIRVSPSVMVPELMESLSITTAEVGTLSAFYLYAYAPLQIPIGILIDFIGARRSLVFASFVCGLGAILFGVAESYWVAALGRVLEGVGSAFAFIGLVYISSFWFSGHIIATLVGLGTGLGFLGGFLADDLVTIGVDLIGWRATSITSGCVGIFLALLMYIAMRCEPPAMKNMHEDKRADPHELIDGFKWICRNWQTWLNSLVSLLGYATTAAFAGLWGVTFFQQAGGVTKATAGLLVSAIFLGWVPGAPLVGRLSDIIDRRKPVIIFFLILAGTTLGITVLFPTLPPWILFVCLFLTGIFGAAQVLTFPYAIEINEGHAAATATALTNFIVMGGAALLQSLVGWLLGQTTPQWAISLFPFSFFAAALLALLYRGRKQV